jgi:hypothetical protein
VEQLWNWKANATGGARYYKDYCVLWANQYNLQVRENRPWTNIAHNEEPDDWYVTELGNNPRIPHPEATPFTPKQLRMEAWSRYNSKFRYHDWHPAGKSSPEGEWRIRDWEVYEGSGCEYADANEAIYTAVEAANAQVADGTPVAAAGFPPGWLDDTEGSN